MGEAFTVYDASTIQVPADTTSANVALPTGFGHATRFYNAGTSPVRIQFGKDNTVAVTKPVAGTKVGSTYTTRTLGSLCLAAGASVEILSRGAGQLYVAFACDTGSTTLEISAGVGF